MFKKYFSLIISILCVLSVLLNSQCRRKCDDPSNPDCPNYDPCYGKTGTSADFKIMEEGESLFSSYAFAYETDTVLNGSVHFEPRKIIEGVEYRWEIGANTYNQPKLTLWFSSNHNNTTIPIKLVVKRNNVDKTCFPNDKGIDSLTKNMFIFRDTRSLIAYGIWDTAIYRGYNLDSPNEIIDLKFYHSNRNGSFYQNRVINLVKEYPGPLPLDISANYRMLTFKNNSQLSLHGCAFLNKNDSISIKYEYRYGTGPSSVSDLIKKEFIGKKIK